MSKVPKKSIEQQEEELINSYKNIPNEELIRGKTPENLQKKCFELCRIYMANNHRWKQFAKNEDDLIVRRISGGLTNQLYFVGLKNVEQSCPNDAVTIKFYQTKLISDVNHKDSIVERFNDLIISIIISERNIGPKVFGLTPNAIIQSYHEHEQFRPKHHHQEKLLRKLAYRLSEVNSLNVPIEKNRFWLLDTLYNYIVKGYEHLNLKSLAKEMDLVYINENDFLNEIEWFNSFIRKYDQCPMVFCHNDFRGSNILVTNNNEDIILCDFEYSSYGQRGYDIATFLWEFDREFLDFKNHDLPSDEIIENFIKFYLEGFDKIEPNYSSKQENSCKQIMEETKIGFLYVYIFFLGVIMNQRETLFEFMPYDVKQQAESVNIMFGKYLQIKKTLIEEKIIK